MKPNNEIAGNYVPLPGSEKAAPSGTALGTLKPDATMSVTIQLRGKKSLDEVLESGQQLSAAEYEKDYGASASDLDAVGKFAAQHHLRVVESSAARKSVVLSGATKDFEEAFQVQLSNFQSADGGTFRGRSGGINIPANLSSIIEGVIGLDDRPQAKPKL